MADLEPDLITKAINEEQWSKIVKELKTSQFEIILEANKRMSYLIKYLQFTPNFYQRLLIYSEYFFFKHYLYLYFSNSFSFSESEFTLICAACVFIATKTISIFKLSKDLVKGIIKYAKQKNIFTEFFPENSNEFRDYESKTVFSVSTLECESKIPSNQMFNNRFNFEAQNNESSTKSGNYTKTYDEINFLKEKLFEYEYKVLYSLNFDTYLKLPHVIIKKYMEEIKTELSNQTYKTNCFISNLSKYMNDSFLTPIIFKYSSETVAFSILKYVASIFQKKIDFENLIKRHPELNNSILEEMEQCCSEFGEMFAKLKDLNSKSDGCSFNCRKMESKIDVSNNSKDRIKC